MRLDRLLDHEHVDDDGVLAIVPLLTAWSRRLMHRLVRCHVDATTLWITIQLSHATHHDVRLVARWCQLLHLLCRGDVAAFRVALCDVFAVSAAQALQEWDDESCSIEWGVVLQDVSFQAAALLLSSSKMLPLDDDDDDDDAPVFDRIQSRLLHSYTSHDQQDGASFDRRTPVIRLQLDLQPPPSPTDHSSRDCMTALATLVTWLRQQQDDSIFALDAVACASLDGLVDVETAAQLASILQHGVRLLALRLHAFVDGADARTLLLRRRLFSPVASTFSQRPSSIETLSVNVDMPLDQLIAVCGALTTDMSVSTLTLYRQDSDLYYDDNDALGSIAAAPHATAAVETSTARWRWLAWSLFSCEAQHRICRLALDLGEALGEFTGAVQQLSRENADRLPPLSADGMATATDDAAIDSSRRCVVPRGVAMDSAVQQLVVVDGAASCDAETKDNCEREAEIGVDGKQCFDRIRELTLHRLSAAGLEHASVFLDHLQPHIKKLTVTRPLVTLHPQRLARLLESSSGIQDLALEAARVPCLIPLLTTFNAGASRLRSLALREIKMRSARPLIAFLKAVADSSSPVGRSLQRLELEIVESNRGGNIDYEAILDASLAALRANDRLERCLVFVPSTTPQIESMYRPQFASLHAKPLGRRRSPLSVSRKIAFLSVVNPSSNMMTTRPIERLDSLVLARIFEFAASCVTRSCELRVKR